MKLTVFNGSPRGEESNTGTLLEHFLNGFVETQGNTYELADNVQDIVDKFNAQDIVDKRSLTIK